MNSDDDDAHRELLVSSLAVWLLSLAYLQLFTCTVYVLFRCP